MYRIGRTRVWRVYTSRETQFQPLFRNGRVTPVILANLHSQISIQQIPLLNDRSRRPRNRSLWRELERRCDRNKRGFSSRRYCWDSCPIGFTARTYSRCRGSARSIGGLNSFGKKCVTHKPWAGHRHTIAVVRGCADILNVCQANVLRIAGSAGQLRGIVIEQHADLCLVVKTRLADQRGGSLARKGTPNDFNGADTWLDERQRKLLRSGGAAQDLTGLGGGR